MFDPGFLKIIEYCQMPSASLDGLLKYIAKESGKYMTLLCTIENNLYRTSMFLVTAPDVYSFPVFTETFCSKFIEELENFQASGITAGRPNTMNKAGVSLDCWLNYSIVNTTPTLINWYGIVYYTTPTLIN